MDRIRGGKPGKTEASDQEHTCCCDDDCGESGSSLAQKHFTSPVSQPAQRTASMPFSGGTCSHAPSSLAPWERTWYVFSDSATSLNRGAESILVRGWQKSNEVVHRVLLMCLQIIGRETHLAPNRWRAKLTYNLQRPEESPGELMCRRNY